MRRVLKWIGIILGGLIGLAVVLLVVFYLLGSARLNRTYAIEPEPVTVPSDAESIAWGEYLAATRGCTDCHGANLGGNTFIDDPTFMVLPAPNLTSGAGGLGATYSDVDWVRAIRHGVRADGTSVMVMPSQDFYYMGNEDLGALIAYIEQIPTVDSDLPPRQYGPIMRIGSMVGIAPPPAAALIDHTAPHPPAPAYGATAEYGGYVAKQICQGCHGADLAGGPVPGEQDVLAPGLTQSGDLGAWTEDDFLAAMRNGVTPSGETLDSAEMPWPLFSQMHDEELQALWLYLESLPGSGAG